jgi:hypothetical protein
VQAAWRERFNDVMQLQRAWDAQISCEITLRNFDENRTHVIRAEYHFLFQQRAY